MQVSSINIGAARPIDAARPYDITGIFKEPVVGPATLTRDGLPGDVIISTRHHGGPDQAVYIYGGADYDWWSAELGQPLAPGTFGENLTVAGLESATLTIGDRLTIGEAILEVTAPRIPCDTFARRMGDPGFVARFRAAERPGCYCRVIRPGQIAAGQAVTLTPYDGAPVTLVEVFRDYYEPDRSLGAIRRFLSAPLAVRARAAKERQHREALRCEG